ncbi:MAG: nucleoside transporter C-terminal domain-containing protein [Chitinispirillaceae bacterium]
MNIYNLISFIGIFVLILTGWLLSNNRKVMNWRVICWGVGLQLAFGLFVFRVPAGAQVLLFVNDAVVKVVDASAAGTKFLFGPLALPPGAAGSPGFILAFQSLPTIIFFSALMSLLFYWKILPFFIRVFAVVFTRLMRISGAEALCASGSMFVGVESAFTVRPHLAEMTRSELCTLLTAGMASVASNVLALYVFMLHAQFPTIAGHLVSASILSIPAAILMSKVMFPETQVPKTLGVSIQPHYEREPNMFVAIINGANTGVRVVVGIAALLLAVLGLIALVDMGTGFLGGRLNALLGMHVDWTLKGLLGYCFYPFSYVMGVPAADAVTVAKIVGERAVATEVAGYQDLAAALAQHAITPRSAVITAYALCGFAHFASMAVFVGGYGALVPERMRELSQVALRALAAATLACLMTACIAGMFYTGQSVLFGK